MRNHFLQTAGLWMGGEGGHGGGRVIGQMGPARKYFLNKQRVAIWHVLSSLLQEVSRMPRSAVRRGAAL